MTYSTHLGFPPPQLYSILILVAAALAATHNLQSGGSLRNRLAVIRCTFATLALTGVALFFAPAFYPTDHTLPLLFTILVYLINFFLILCFFFVLSGYHGREGDSFDGILDITPRTPPPTPPSDSMSFQTFLEQAPSNQTNKES